MIEKALEFAAKMHEGQYRKNSRTPYIVHPAEVMYYLLKANADEELVCAGVLHDTIEDTQATFNDILSNFNQRVAKLVLSQTEDKTKTWAERKLNTESFLLNATNEERLLCCCDKLSNLKSIYYSDGNIWSFFSGTKEKIYLHYSKLKQLYLPLKTEYPFIYNEFCKYFDLVFLKEGL